MKQTNISPNVLAFDSASLSPNEVGDLLGVTGEAVKTWIRTNKLPAVKLNNGYWRINRSELQRFIDERDQEARPRVLVFVSESLWLRISVPILNAPYVMIRAHNYADAILKIASCKPSILLVDLSLQADAWRVLRHKTRDLLDKALVFSSDLRDERTIAHLAECRTTAVLSAEFTHEVLLDQLALIANGR